MNMAKSNFTDKTLLIYQIKMNCLSFPPPLFIYHSSLASYSLNMIFIEYQDKCTK